ncbi:MAG: hypothetical protein A3F41_06345 [Coxiella sp. RIFCSPHIGHO2_12_FULL_44_14]|nr:MAG: hypothetical protein A3F41_06345 [Coxiella sp. RIFCSPHIGHO2_12_FULL_44_14]
MKKCWAISLLELLIVIFIIGVLAAVAVPTYRSYILRSNRSDAIHTLLNIQLAEEKYRMDNATYGNLSEVWGGVGSTPGGHYALTITSITATSYTITATAVGTQANDSSGGVSCDALVLSYANGATTKTPAVCWSEG